MLPEIGKARVDETRAFQKDPAASYSPALICAVPSALEGLTAVFGMGTGVSPPQ